MDENMRVGRMGHTTSWKYWLTKPYYAFTAWFHDNAPEWWYDLWYPEENMRQVY